MTNQTPEMDRSALKAELEQITGIKLPEAEAAYYSARDAVDEMELASISNPISLTNLRTVADSARDAVMELIHRRNQIHETLSNGGVAKIEAGLLEVISSYLAEHQADWERSAGVVMGQFTVLVYDAKGKLRDVPRLVMNSSVSVPSTQMKYQLRSGHRPFTRADVSRLTSDRSGLYAIWLPIGATDRFECLYVGMSETCLRTRLLSHLSSETNPELRRLLESVREVAYTFAFAEHSVRALEGEIIRDWAPRCNRTHKP